MTKTICDINLNEEEIVDKPQQESLEVNTRCNISLDGAPQKRATLEQYTEFRHLSRHQERENILDDNGLTDDIMEREDIQDLVKQMTPNMPQ